MDLSIIIANYRSWKSLLNCLESILSADKTAIDFEVIVVDNFSNDGQFDVYQKKFPNFIFIRNSNNYGFASGCNLGVKQAKGNYFLFLNPDTIISPNTLTTLYTTYKNHPEIGILSCLQTDQNNRFYNQDKKFPSLSRILGLTIFSIEKKDNSLKNKELFYPDWVSGAIIFIGKDWFSSVNGWNEDYWLYYEDVEICQKITQKKGKIAVSRETTILHKHGGSSRIDFETEHSCKTEVLISKHVYINNNFNTVTRILSHLFLILFTITEKIFLSFLSLFLSSSSKIKINRFILKNLFSYYFNALKQRSWLSNRSVNYPGNL